MAKVIDYSVASPNGDVATWSSSGALVGADGNAWTPRKNTIVFYGDSHQQTGHVLSLTGSSLSDFNEATAFPYWVQSLTGWRFDIIGWQAVGGQTSAQILGWIDDVIALRPGVVCHNAGTNDFLVANVTDPEVTVANITETWRRLTEAGIFVVATTTLITDPTNAGLTATEYCYINMVNHRLRELAPCYQNLALVDAFALGVNPTSATGAQRTNYLQPDKTHTTNLYAYKIGKAVAAILNARFPPVDRLISSVFDYNGASGQGANHNLMANSLFTTTTGGTVTSPCTGTAPSGWTIARASGAAGSIVSGATCSARSDGYGNNLVLPCVGDAAESIGILKAEYTISTTGLVAGEKYYAKAEITLDSGATEIRQVSFRLFATNGTINYEATNGNSSNTANIFPFEEGWTRTDISPICVIPSGTITSFYIRVMVYVGPSASGTVRIGRISLHKTTGSRPPDRNYD